MELPDAHRGLAEGGAIGRIRGIARVVPLVACHFELIDSGTIDLANQREKSRVATLAWSLPARPC